MSKKVKRLFDGFRPENYQLEINPDRDTMQLNGAVVISGQKTGRPSQRLTFHQHGLKVTKATIIRNDKKGKQEIPLVRINHQRKLDEVRLHTSALLYPGTYTVRMEFEGEITRPMEGVYPCFFKHEDKDKKLIATQFESHHARDAFPCVDEPEAKATFDLTLISPAGETVLANTSIKSQETKDDKLVTTFETTPKMSTYLLAFVYGELGYKEAKTKRGVTVRAYATPDNVQHLDYAAEFGAKCLDFYEEYFDIPFPLAKCDFVALPDFAAGAMENWGLITFREQALLYDKANSSLPMKQYVAQVIAHELTHQWFGNLVTMRWWTDLWLNEGFTERMAYLPMDHFYPEWQIWTQLVADQQQLAFKFDALANTHPIQVPINSPEEIRTIFDNISYDKGACCLHMLEQYLGKDIFQGGLRHYLKKHSYGNTDTTDLWQALEDVSGKPVKNFMATWIEQAGFPLVRAHIKDGEIHLTQEQFLLNPRERNKEGLTEPLWPVALESGAEELPELFDQPEVTLPLFRREGVLKLNSGQSSFFRATYNASHLEKLAEQVTVGNMSIPDRIGLLSDAFEAAKAGYADTTMALHLLESYRNEQSDTVWDIIAANLVAIRRLMDDEQLREDMKPYVRALVAEQLERLSWEEKVDEPHSDKLLRPTILSLASAADETSVIDEALRRFKAMKRPEDLPPDLRAVIYVTAARKGDSETFDQLLTLHNQSISSDERSTLSAAITDFEQPELIARALKTITTEDVRKQDIIGWVAYSFGNRHARKQTWNWMVDHWEWLKQHLGGDLAFFRMPLYAARAFSDEKFLAEYREFFESVMSPALERSYKQGVEMIEWQTDWRKRDLKTIKAFFRDRAKP